MNEPAESWVGRRLAGRYTVHEAIGTGGMGAVYEATQDDLGRRVAVKLLHAHLAARPDLLTRLKREAMAAAALGHPNIVQVTDFCHAPGEPAFLVMERLDGQSLRGAIADAGRLSAKRVAFITAQALSALEAAHAAGIVHRDLKPENIFLTTIAGVPDIVKLLDFGLAKHSQIEEQSLTATGTVMGTPAYMAPEQIRAEEVTTATDVYAMGAVMYHALTGQMPFAGENQYALMYSILEKPPVSLAVLRPELEAELVALVERAMAKNASDRYADATAMRKALTPFVPGAAIAEPSKSASRRGWSPSPSNVPSFPPAGFGSDASTIGSDGPLASVERARTEPERVPPPNPVAPAQPQGHLHHPYPPYPPPFVAPAFIPVPVPVQMGAAPLHHEAYPVPGPAAMAPTHAPQPTRPSVPPASPLTVLGKIAGFGLLSFGALWLLLIPFMLAEGDSGAALGGLLIGLFFAVPGALVVGLMRHHRLTSEFQNGVIGLIWSHDAFTAGELAPKIGKSEQATERLIAGLSRRAGIPLVYHAGERRYYHPSRLTRRHAVSTHCQRCGAALSREVLFEGETRRCRYCDSPAASLPPPPP